MLVFSVKPLKIDQNKTQNRLIDKVWNVGKDKRGNYAKTLTKIQVTAILITQVLRRKYLRRFIGNLYGDAMLEPIQISTNMAAGNQQQHLTLSFATKG